MMQNVQFSAKSVGTKTCYEGFVLLGERGAKRFFMYTFNHPNEGIQNYTIWCASFFLKQRFIPSISMRIFESEIYLRFGRG
jgi:hypothetical protein